MQTDTPSIRSLFDSACDLSGEARAQFLSGLEGAQRAYIERLLAAADTDTGAVALNVDAASLVGALDEPPLPAMPASGQQVGPWQLIALIGEGGSSTVFRAAREHAGVRQEAALKLLRRGLYTAEAQRQFRRERQVLAQLSHPDIASLIEGGVTGNGLAYIVLEFVDGVSITQYARNHTLDLRARLRLFLRVCRAVDAAHRALIVHRDLKPSNVLVTGEGHVKLLDFGIAKLLDADDDTQTRLPAFTPAYAAPEQRTGALITTATDVYALGILLGELMTGQRLNTGSNHTPSGQVDEHSEPGVLPATPRVTRKLLRGDLDNIVLKAIAEEPERRYASAGAMADDIERLLDGRPVIAHPPSRWYRARKFVKRHRGGVAISALFLIAIFSALALALWEANVARHEALRANAVRDFVERIFEPVREGFAEGKTPTIRDLVATGVGRLHADAELGPHERVDLTLMFAKLTDSVGEGARAAELVAEAEKLATASLPVLDPLAISTLTKHGALAVRAGDYTTGERVLRDAERRLRESGNDPAALADVLDNLAVIEFDRDHAQASLKLEEEALDLRIRAYGPDARETATGYNNLGYGLEGVNRFDEAAEAYRRTYEIDLKYREPESYTVLSDLGNWGSTLERAGHVRRARELLAQALAGMEKIQGKPRKIKIITAGKLCGVDVALHDMAAAERDCARMLEIGSDASGQGDSRYADVVRQEASRLFALGRVAEARAATQHALDIYGDAKENQSRRALMLRTRAQIAWIEGNIEAARDDILAARAHMTGYAGSSQEFEANGIAALACAAASAPSCPADIDSILADNLEHNAADPHPRMLLAWIALARRQLDNGDPARARQTLERGIESTRAELDDAHPLLRTAQVWRAITLDADGKCAEAAQVRAQFLGSSTEDDAFPWLGEANAQLARLAKCPMPALAEIR